MALTPLRWVAVAAGAALLVGAYFLAPGTRSATRQDTRDSLAHQVYLAELEAVTAAERLLAIRTLDSLRPLLARSDGDTVRAFIDRRLPDSTREQIRMALRRSQALTGASRLAVDVVVMPDTVQRLPGVHGQLGDWIRLEYSIPASPGERCLVLLRMRQEVAALPPRRVEALVAPGRLLGPCAFVARFGMPGPAVAEWLWRGGWSMALGNTFIRRTPAWQPSWRVEETPEERRGGGVLRWFVGDRGYRCISGDRDMCGALVRDVTLSNRQAVDMWDNRVVSSLSLRGRGMGMELGSRQAMFLPDLVHELGPEAFSRFWTSRLPLEDAIRGASGRELSDIAQQWAVRQYGDDRRRGPGLPRGSAPVGLALVVLATTAAVWKARRREVG